MRIHESRTSISILLVFLSHLYILGTFSITILTDYKKQIVEDDIKYLINGINYV